MFVRLLVALLALFYVVCGKSVNNPKKYGYLSADLDSPSKCVKPQPSKICSLNYNIFQFDGPVGAALLKTMYTSVSLTLKTLENFSVNYTKECLENLRHYACNNTFAECDKTGVHYNVKDTETACANVMATCPKQTLEYLVYNCANINRDPMDWVTCDNLGDPGICKTALRNNYKYAKEAVKQYPEHIKLFEQTVAAIKQYLTNECIEKFVGINCEIQPGAICSTDQKLRMYAISSQDCLSVMDTCLNHLPSQIQDVFQMMCQLLPDATTAPKVPLPSNDLLSNDLK